jgi:spore maturation protein CgeB
MMKVAFCKWTSICEVGVDNGLTALGYEVIRVPSMMDSVDYDMEYASRLLKVLNEEHPDCVFSINFIPIISRVCNIHKIPYICWIVDSPCFQLYSDTIANPYNRIFIFDRDLYHQFYSKNPESIFHLSLASDLITSDSIEITPEHHKAYDCDISFVGSLYSEKTRYNSLTNLPDSIRGYVDALIDAQLQVFGYNFIADTLSPEFVSQFKSYAAWVPLAEDYEENDLRIIADTYIGYKCTEQDRIRTLNALASRFNVHLYTQSDTSPLENVHCMGPADSTKMMPHIMKCSKINLNLTNKPISSGLPLRIFDIMGNGGFVISNYQPEIPELFELDREIVTYTSIPDLLEKTEYYLTHEEERLTIARNGYKKIKLYHSYTEKLSTIFQLALEREDL